MKNDFKKKILGMALLCCSALYSQTENPVETVLQKGHSRYVTCVAYSPDGHYIVTGSFDNRLILWNAKNGKEIRTFSMHTSFIRSVFFSPDGRHILTSSGDNRALVYDITTGQVITEIKINKNRLFKAVFSPDGSKILTMDDRSEIIVWDAFSGECTGTYKKDYTAAITSQWFSTDGNLLLTYKNNKTSQLIDFNDSLKTITYTCESPNTYSISRDNKYVAIGTNKKKTVIFERATGKELYILDPDTSLRCTGCKTLIAISHNSNYIITADKYAGIVLWDLRKGKIIKSFDFKDTWLDEISFSPDDRYILATADDESYIWDIRTGKEVLYLSHNGLKCIPVFNPDSKTILSTNQNNTAACWDLNSGRKLRVFGGFLNKTRDDGLKFDEGNWYHSNIIRYLSLKSKVTITPDGRYYIKGRIDSIAVMVNIESGNVERRFAGHSKVVLCTDVSRDGKLLATGSGDKSIKLWDIESGQLIRTLKGHQEVIFDVKFSSDGKFLVSGSWDATMRIWETATGKVVKYINFDKYSPYVVRYTPNDLYVVTADLDKKLRLWEADAIEEFRNIIGHTDLVTDLCFSPDGRQMISAGLDGKVKVWDLMSGMLQGKFLHHISGVYAVVCHPNGDYIISGGIDRKIKIWNPETGLIDQILYGHSGAVTSLNISPDGKKLISCTIDGEVKVWELETFSELYTYIQIDRENWLAKSPHGHFDGSPDGLKRINYVSGLNVITVGSLFEKYYTPNLIRRINEGEDFSEISPDINRLIEDVPEVEIRILPDNDIRELTFSDTVEWFNDTITLSVGVIDQGGGVDELRIYNNGKLISNENYKNKAVRSGKRYEKTIEVAVLPGENIVTAVALNQDRIESDPKSLNIFYDGIVSDISLYIFSIGINEYENPAYALDYAIEDARSYTKTIKKGATSIFNSVEEIFIKDSETDKEQIKSVFNEIAQRAGPEDVFVFYYAGHGSMSMGNDNERPGFYIIPYNVTKLYGDDELLKTKAISAEELLELSKKIEARKQMFILDACQAGGALSAFNTRGADREKAIAQLARSTGTFFLLASGAVQYASEARELGHGIFTYAILEALEGKADGGSMDSKITANELKSYVEDRVPELTKEYMLTPQYPTGYSYGQDFPIVIVR